MKNLIGYLSVLMLMLGSCAYPYYTKKQIRNSRPDIVTISREDIALSSFHYSAGLRSGRNRIIADTLVILDRPDTLLLLALQKFGLRGENLVNDPSLQILIDPELRWRFGRLVQFLERQSFSDNTLVPILCYNAGLEPERSGGGGIGPVYNTGNDRYFIVRELILAFYQNNDLVYLRRIAQRDEKIVPAGTPITHEFPQEVLDTLMHMALEPLMKQMDKGR